MRKRPAIAVSEDDNFIKAYFELKKLRERLESIERSSRRAATAKGRDTAKGDDSIHNELRV